MDRETQTSNEKWDQQKATRTLEEFEQPSLFKEKACDQSKRWDTERN